MINLLTSRGFKIFLAVLVAALLVTAPFYLRNFGLYLIAMWLVISVAALGLNLTLGYAGQVSMAQGAFVGIGAYATGLMTLAGIPWPVAFLCSGLLCFAIGWVLGYPALRVQHHYLAFVTLAFSTLVFLLMRNEEWLTKGIYGLTDVPRPVLFGWNTGKAFDFYFFVLGVVTLLSLAVWWIIRSPWGRALVALRENPVRDNLILAGQEHEGSMIDRLLGPRDAGLTASANQMIEFFRLSHVADEKAGGLSYGQQKLLDAAMAFMAGPRLVLLDEPAGGVNLTMLGHLRDRLKAINTEQNATFVVIEHNMEFVMALCNRIIVLAEGKIIAEGTPDEIRSNPEVIEAYLGH